LRSVKFLFFPNTREQEEQNCGNEEKIRGRQAENQPNEAGAKV